MRIQNGLPCTKSKFGQIWRRERGRDSECLTWARRQQKAAAKSARFGVHFTQIIRFPAFHVKRVETVIVGCRTAKLSQSETLGLEDHLSLARGFVQKVYGAN